MTSQKSSTTCTITVIERNTLDVCNPGKGAVSGCRVAWQASVSVNSRVFQRTDGKNHVGRPALVVLQQKYGASVEEVRETKTPPLENAYQRTLSSCTALPSPSSAVSSFSSPSPGDDDDEEEEEFTSATPFGDRSDDPKLPPSCSSKDGALIHVLLLSSSCGHRTSPSSPTWPQQVAVSVGIQSADEWVGRKGGRG